MQQNQSLVVPFFKAEAVMNPVKSKAAGRPIYDDLEVCEIRMAGERNYAPVVPAHSMWQRVDGEEVTYAMRWPEEYARFKEGREQVASGTPLSEMPFLTEANRHELRALKVYTAEALASLDGKNLSALGAFGREWKNAAAAYLDRAGGGAAQVAALTAQIEELKARLSEGSAPVGIAPAPAIAAGDDEEKRSLKDRIEALTGARPRGNPSVETLRETLAELSEDV